MKKLLVVISLLIIITMGLSAEDISDSTKEKLNNYILTFQAQKITYNGIEGFFIPIEGWNQLTITLRDYIYFQDLVLLKDERIKQLEKLELTNFKLKTALGVTIAFDVGSLFLCAGLGILCYNMALIK